MHLYVDGIIHAHKSILQVDGILYACTKFVVFKIHFGKIVVVIMMVIVFYGYVWLEGLVHVQMANIRVCSNERPSLLNLGLEQKLNK
jgi:hypothetical protein